MRAKTLLLLLLVLPLNIPANGRAFFIKDDSIDCGQESWPEDERQERAFAVHFIKRLNVTDDFAPLTREFYVKDSIFHIRKYILDQDIDDPEFAQAGIDKRILVLANHDDYWRAYLALMNAWHQYHQLIEAVDGYVATRNSVEGGDISDARYRKLGVTARDEALTPAFFTIADSNPLLSILVSSLILGADNSNEAAYNTRLKAATIRTVKELRAFMTTLTRCVEVMRKAVRKLRIEQDRLRVGRQIEFKYDNESIDIYKYWTEILEKRTYGVRKGTKLIYARIYPYEIVMTRRRGRLRVVVVYPDFDGD